VEELPSFDGEEEIKIGFINMDDSGETVNLVDAGIFVKDHHIDDYLPSFQDVANTDAKNYN
jgi:hypothetical protein